MLLVACVCELLVFVNYLCLRITCVCELLACFLISLLEDEKEGMFYFLHLIQIMINSFFCISS